MKPRRSLLQPTVYLLALFMAVPPLANAASNRKPSSNAGSDQMVRLATPVVLNGQRSHDPDGTIEHYEWSQLQGAKVNLSQAKTVRASFKSPTMPPLSLVFKLTVTDNQGATASDTVVVTVIATGKLNDTGITTCSNDIVNNLDCPVEGYPGQDAEFGRDKTDNDPSDTRAGFSFTKIDDKGQELSNDASDWNCLRDNVTGLLWEFKTGDSSLHDKKWTYTWYEPNKSKNGGNAGVKNGGKCGKTSLCDTFHYVNAVNKKGLCGAKNWRMPTRQELLSIARYDIFYSGSVARSFWSSSIGLASVDIQGKKITLYPAWKVDDNGLADWGLKTSVHRIRLVHDAR